MKKLICFLSVLMAATCLFAAGAKWKSSDIYHPKKFNKLIQTYNLTKTYTNDKIEVYKNEETKDWVYIYREGSEENNDKRIYFTAFASLGGVFDSCMVYGGFTSHAKDVKYFYSYINEGNTAIPKGDFLGRSTYVWNNPAWIFWYMFRYRAYIFTQLNGFKTIMGLEDVEIPEEVVERYAYFSEWLIENNKDEDAYKKIRGEYSAYLKEHK